MYDILIKHGLIIDGQNQAPYMGTIGIKDDTIIKIEPDGGEMEMEEAKKIIDADGKLVTPGFIDIHCHSDAIVFYPDKNPKRLQQGFTTEVIGNCGISAAPVNPRYLDLLKKYCDPYYSSIPLPYNWKSYKEYLEEVEKYQPMLNTAALVGHGSLRVAVTGFDDRKLTPQEMEKMEDLLAECLEQGAFGMSSGLIYPPGIFADDEEIVNLARVVKEHGGMYATHMRSESEGLIESVEETLRVARLTGVNTEISHHKAAGRKNHGKVKTTLAMIEAANQEGLSVNCDCYPYDAASTQFSAILPPWAMEGGVDKLLCRLADPDLRARMIADIKNEEPDYESFYQLSGWDKILINECAVERYVGKTVQQIAEEAEKDPFETALDIIKDSGNNVMMIVFFMSSEDVSRVIQNPYSMICTDGFPSLGTYHPRYIASFIRVLEKYVKQEYLLSLPQAIYKMTGMPAEKIGIRDRGRLVEGMKADILVIDFEKLHDNSDYEHHDALANGMEYVIINGEMALEHGIFRRICAGKVLRSTDGKG